MRVIALAALAAACLFAGPLAAREILRLKRISDNTYRRGIQKRFPE